MNKNKIILFDLDGTLIDSTDAILSSFNHTFKELEFDFQGNNESIKALIGYPLDIMYKELGVNETKVWDFVDAYKKRYKQISKEQTYILNNAYEAVVEASKFARVSVVNTKTRIYSTPLLENLNIMEYFEIITGREDVENPKPHPEPILKTLSLMNYDKDIHEVWMIGDTKLDLIAAREANINSVGVLCGYGEENELKNYTNYVEKDALAAINFIKQY
uniref:HAD family hydrolase n=1 Tax=Aliarcobacter sp. TaxID=2321116 RepID=UPI00404846EB